jgi:ABC-2 type transport system ATP-binding protein
VDPHSEPSASTARSAISINGISKRYGRLTAVKDLKLEVNQGEVFGFLGLNGAGKTTTIRILLDLLRPSAGRASVMGRDCQSQGLEVRSLVSESLGDHPIGRAASDVHRVCIVDDDAGHVEWALLSGAQGSRVAD